MSFAAVAAEQPDYALVPEGQHLAICNLIAYIGVQPSRDYEPQPKVYLRWELPNEKYTYRGRSELKNIGAHYTKAKKLSPKSYLRVALEAWRGRPYAANEPIDVSEFLGKACLLVVSHKIVGEKVYANVTGVLPLPEGAVVPASTSDRILYDADDHDPLMFSALPKWLKESVDRRVPDPKPASAGPPPPAEPVATATADFDDDIPF
jgi:hypothetical protein